MSRSDWDSRSNEGGRGMLSGDHKYAIISFVGTAAVLLILISGIGSITGKMHRRDIKMAQMGFERVTAPNVNLGWSWKKVNDDPIIVEKVVVKQKIVRVNKNIDHDSAVAFLRKELEKEPVS